MPALVMLGRLVRHSSQAVLTEERAPTPGSLSPLERAASDIEEAVRSRWPTDEEIAARKKHVREQKRRMKRENPGLYKRLPLLHEADD